MINVQGQLQLPFAGDKETRTESLSQSSKKERELSAQSGFTSSLHGGGAWATVTGTQA